MTSEFHWDYPKEKIGGGNPYWCCKFCGISDPQINGQLKNHAPNCEYRIKNSQPVDKSKIENLTDEEKETIVELQGWEIQCKSPLEVADNEGSFATGFAAKVMIDYLVQEYLEGNFLD